MKCLDKPNMVGLGNDWRYVTYSLSDSHRPLTRRECRNLFYNAARIRKRSGDKDGAKRMNFGAQCVSGDARKRHDV